MDRLKSAVNKILARLPNARGRGEVATKQSLVLPLLDALGYDIWNPAEVCPEYEADFAIKKYGQKEKVDLALFLQDVPRIDVEVKSVDEPLDGHEGQLSRDFNATPTPSKSVHSPAPILRTRPRPRHFHHPPGLGPRTASTPKAPPLPAAPRPPASCPNGHMVCVSRPRKGAGTQRPSQRPTTPEPIREYARELYDTARIVNLLRHHPPTQQNPVYCP
jgi:hypothetical protein